MPQLKTVLDRKLESLTDDDLNRILEFVQYLEWRKQTLAETDRTSPAYASDNDPLLGLFDGPPEMASNAEEILAQAAGENAGWTWKHSSQ